MEEKAFQYSRAPALRRKINEISEKDIRARILGRIIDISDSTIIIDDGTGKADIIFDPDMLSVNVKTGDLVGVFARVLPLEEGFELRAEIIQNMNGLDYELYRKVFHGV